MTMAILAPTIVAKRKSGANTPTIRFHAMTVVNVPKTISVRPGSARVVQWIAMTTIPAPQIAAPPTLVVYTATTSLGAMTAAHVPKTMSVQPGSATVLR